MYNDNTLGPTVAVLAVIGVLGFLALRCNVGGANHDHAVKEAHSYVEQLRKSGIAADFVECTNHDTDGDGYLACTIAVDGKPETVDCAGAALVWENHGCKEYVAKMRRQ